MIIIDPIINLATNNFVYAPNGVAIVSLVTDFRLLIASFGNTTVRMHFSAKEHYIAYPD